MKTQKHTAITLTITMLLSLIFPALPTQAQSNQPTRSQTGRRGQATRSWRAEATAENQSLEMHDRRPDWVSNAARRSLTRLTAMREKLALENVATELTLRSAEQDDLGQTHLRLAQKHHGVEVFGAQLVSHVKGNDEATIGGRTFDVKEIETTPAISAEQAIENAKAALSFNGEFAVPPSATLVVLPHEVFSDEATNEATLTYQVNLQIEDGTEATAAHQYFVNAQDGQIVWHYNALPHGTGYSLYSGTVPVPSTYVPPSGIFGAYYQMRDPGRGGSTTTNMNNGTATANNIFYNSFDTWGNGTKDHTESAAVDAQFGVQKSWDYFLNVLGRRGMDGNGGAIESRVHYGTNYDNAFYSPKSNKLSYGDGSGSMFNPLVSLDIVAHEFTHGVTERTAGLIYSKESGALNESFSDIFGVAVEYYANLNPDYLIGEDCYTPNTSGDALRDMANPSINHYRNRLNPGACTPSDSNDQCGVHTNSGIQNNAFYLLAVGGTNSTSNVTVPGIGRRNAELIFWRALSLYLFPSANFYDARVATVNAAVDLFGPNSKEHRATETAWDAVGVSGADLFFYNDQNGQAAAVEVTDNGVFGWQTNYGAGSLSTQWTDIVATKNHQFFYNWRNGLYAVTKTNQNGQMGTLSNGYLPAYTTKVVSTDSHILLYKGSDRSGVVGQVNASGQFVQTQSFGAYSFSYWSEIVDTQYGMFFYNRIDGTIAVCHVQANGTLRQTDGRMNYLPAGMDQVIVQGANVLLYDNETGAYISGAVGSDGKFFYNSVTSCGATLGAGYRKIVAAGNKLFFYNPSTGAGAVGYISRSSGPLSPYPYYCEGQLRIQKTYTTFATGWTHLVDTSNGLLFYNINNRSGAVGRFASDGSFIQTQGFGAGAFGYWSHIVTLEK
ncbi:MAG TPA: M4 family metallopeptidase [Blastocatellia bacterium]|nr:M4 family metallopeptidase [Blastocatellia bacterium]